MVNSKIEHTNLVSIVIVNRNGIEFLNRCLTAISFSTYTQTEIIIVDNNSKDGSQYICTLQTGGDYGPAVARNMGAKYAKGKYILFLDNDTEVKEDAISEMIAHMHRQGDVMCTAHLLRITDKQLDSAGDYINRFGFLVANKHLSPVLSVKTAACMVEKKVFAEVGGFDESYYMYLEDTDLAWRVNKLYVGKVGFAKKAIVYHSFDTPLKVGKYDMRNVRYNGCRNYITTLIKNLSVSNLFLILPLHVLCWLVIALLLIGRGKRKEGKWIMEGIWYNVRHFTHLIKKRSKGRCMEEYFMIRDSIREYVRKIKSYIR